MSEGRVESGEGAIHPGSSPLFEGWNVRVSARLPEGILKSLGDAG